MGFKIGREISNIKSHHIVGNIIPQPGQCKVCHLLYTEQSPYLSEPTHAQGKVILRNADTNEPIEYKPNDPSTAEPFCLSCHDKDGATATYLKTDEAGNPNYVDQVVPNMVEIR